MKTLGTTKIIGTIAALLLLALNVSPAYALSSGDIVSAGSVWVETTTAVALVFIMAMAFSLQIARGYFLRTLDKFTLRLGADIWWLAYVLIRDGLIFISFTMGLLVFFPGTLLDYPMAVPFMPVSVVLFGAALLTKLYTDADENPNAFRFVTLLVFLATSLWIFGVVFITETPLALTTLPSSVSATSGFWYQVYNTFASTQNIDLAMVSTNVCFAALGVIAIFGFAHPIINSRIRTKGVTTEAVESSVSIRPARAAPSSNLESGKQDLAA